MPPTLKTRKQPSRASKLTPSRTFGSKSPLISTEVDISLFLVKCMSQDVWLKYTLEEKKAIYDSLPRSIRNQPQVRAELSKRKQEVAHKEASRITGGTTDSTSTTQDTNIAEQETIDLLTDPPLTSNFILSDEYLKRAIARFRRDLADSYYEKSWQDKAARAQQDKLDGKFDEYLRMYSEELFASDDEEEELETNRPTSLLDTGGSEHKDEDQNVG